MAAEFKVRTDATTHSTNTHSVPIYFPYKDWYHHQVADLPLTGGRDAASLFLTIPTPTKPSFGDAQLKGYELGVFVNYIDYANTYTNPEYKLYKMTEPVVKEGTFGTLDTKDILVYTMRNDNAVTMFEDFKGAVMEIETEVVKSSIYYSLPTKWAYDNAKGIEQEGKTSLRFEQSFDRFKERYDRDGFVPIKEGKKFWQALIPYGKSGEIYRPVHRKLEWDDPWWSKDEAEANAETEGESSEVDDKLFTTEGTLFSSSKRGTSHRYTDPEGTTIKLDYDRILFDESGGATSGVNARFSSFKHHGWNGKASSLMIHTAKLPTGIPYGREAGNTETNLVQPLALQVTATVNFETMAPAYNVHGGHRDDMGGDVAAAYRDSLNGYYNSSHRGFYIVIANTAPYSNETYDAYIKRLNKDDAFSAGIPHYWNSVAFQNIFGAADADSDVFVEKLAFCSYNIRGDTAMVNWRRGNLNYVNPANIITMLNTEITLDTERAPLHELPQSRAVGWRGDLPFGEFLNINFVFPINKTHHYVIVTNLQNEVLAAERCGMANSALTNAAMDCNHLSLWMTSFPNHSNPLSGSSVECYTKSSKQDMEMEILIDSLTVRGATPTRTNCTVLDNYLKNPISIKGDIEQSGHAPIMDHQTIESNFLPSGFVSLQDERTLHAPEEIFFSNQDDDENNRVKVGNYIAFGLKGNLSGSREILFNNFKCDSQVRNSAIPSGNIVAWKSMAHATNNPLGHTINKDTLIDNNITSKFTFNGTKLVDYFTKKGFVTVSSGDTTLEERECIVASTRIIKYLGGAVCVVDNPELLVCDDGESFMMYRAGSNYASGAYKKDLKIESVDITTGEVRFNQNLDSYDMVFSDSSGVTFARGGVQQVQMFAQAVAADVSSAYDARWFALYDGDNKRHVFHFNAAGNEDEFPADMGFAHSLTLVDYTADQNADTMAANIGVAVQAHPSFSCVVSDDDCTVTNAFKGACETAELSSAWATEVAPSTAGTTLDDTIVDTGAGFGVFVAGQFINVHASTSATPRSITGWFNIKTASAGTLTLYTPEKGHTWIGTGDSIQPENNNAKDRFQTNSETPSSTFRISSILMMKTHSDFKMPHSLFVSPQRKWFGFEIFNYDASEIALPTKTFEGVLIGSTAVASQTSGPTYNERMYTDMDGYKQKWDITNEKGSLLEWSTEYNKEDKFDENEDFDNFIAKWTPKVVSAGQVASIASTTFTLDDAWSELQYNNYGRKVVLVDDGTHTGTTTTINDVDVSGALNKFSVASATSWAAADTYQISGYNIINMDTLVESNDIYEEGEFACFYLTSTDLADLNITHIDTYNGSADNPPFLLTSYTDEMPIVKDFKVSPDENNPFYANYKWSAADEDLWYGFLIQDYKTIESQYTNSVLHLPLDDSMPDGDLIQDDIFNLIKCTRRYQGAYSETNITDGQFADSFEGLSGHCKEFGSNTYMTIDNSSGTFFTQPSAEMSVVLHFRQDDAPSTTEYLLRYGDSWGIYIDSDGYINAWIRANSVGSSSSGTNAPTIYLKSTSLPSYQGVPCSVIFTVDHTLGTGNVKLFIDGKLEDQSGKKTTLGSLNNWAEGYTIPNNEVLTIAANQTLSGTWPSKTSSNEFDGKMEEIVIYDKAIYPVVPTDGEITIFKAFEELSTGTYASGRSVIARLFIKDYHNLRGKSSSEVACTSPVAWKKSGIGLDTYNI